LGKFRKLFESSMKFSKYALKIFETAKEAGGEARIVGGAIRDFLLLEKPIESGDVDFSINLPVEKVAEIFTKIGAKVITKYATNIVVWHSRVFEITSTRKDENCDGRYATMIFTTSFEEDSNRRDFTMNALYMNQDGKIFDYHNGVEDLKEGLVKFIGNPYYRIEEDYLRIWRFFRFFALYGKRMDVEGFDACKKNAEKIYLISKERATTEVLKMLKSDPEKIKFTLGKMIEAGILKEEDWNLEFRRIPADVHLRLLILIRMKENNLLSLPVAQKKLIKLYNSVKEKMENKEDLYFFYYTTNPEDFKNIIEIHKSFNNAFVFEKVLPSVPFSQQSIMKEGFVGKEISSEYKARLKAFIKKMVPDV